MHSDGKRDIRDLVEVLESEFGTRVFVPEHLDDPTHVVFAVSGNDCPCFSVCASDAPDLYSVQVEFYGPAHEKPLGAVGGVKLTFPMDLVEDCQTDLDGLIALFRKYRHARGDRTTP